MDDSEKLEGAEKQDCRVQDGKSVKEWRRAAELYGQGQTQIDE